MQGNFDPVTFNMMLNMMNVMHPNMGYNSNNYNYNMNNSADSMNLMMNWMNMNPLLLQMYNNNMFQNNNMSQNYNNNINLNNSNNRQANVTGGINTDIPNTCYDLSQNSNDMIMNVVFIHQTGKKIMMKCPFSMKVKELLLQYILRMGLSDSLIGKEIFFIYNGLKINEKEDKTVSQYFFQGMLHSILVVDAKNIIGAKSLSLK
jgi:hypothetical protein